MQRPSWLVLGQSYSDGWRASCRDAQGRTTDLGAPIPIDAYANGWRVGPSCTEASFSFPPQRLATAGYVISAIAILALLAIALLGWRRDRREAPAPEPTTRPTAHGPRPTGQLRLPVRQAIAVAAAVAAAGALLFAIRVGAVLGPLAFLALWRGIDARRLVALSCAAVALLPVIYLVSLPKNPGGDSFTYASDLLGPHWVAVFAVASLGAASLLMALDLRRADDAVPGDELAQERDPDEEREPRPVARLDPVDP